MQCKCGMDLIETPEHPVFSLACPYFGFGEHYAQIRGVVEIVEIALEFDLKDLGDETE